MGDEQRRRFLASTLNVIPAPQGRSDFRRKMDQPLTVMMIGTLLLPTLACVNVANLLLARAMARNREVTTRIALGASQGRIVSQLVVDGLLIAVAGGALGLASAPAIAQMLISFLPQSSAGLDLSARIDARVALVFNGRDECRFQLRSRGPLSRSKSGQVEEIAKLSAN